MRKSIHFRIGFLFCSEFLCKIAFYQIRMLKGWIVAIDISTNDVRVFNLKCIFEKTVWRYFFSLAFTLDGPSDKLRSFVLFI